MRAAGCLLEVIVMGLAGFGAGCGFHVDGNAVPGEAGDGNPINPVDDAPDLPNCVGSPGSVTGRICFTQLPTAPIAITGNITINTATSDKCATNVVSANPAPDAYCVVAGSTVSIALGSTVTAIGTRPLVLVSTSTITVAGNLDVASHIAGNVGAGSHPAACAAGGAPTGGGGGAGGSFGSAGAVGGTSRVPAGLGASAGPTAVPTTLRGGCDGSRGAGTMGGEGGRGGGAVGLTAAQAIVVNGSVNASGAGGFGPSDYTNGTIYGAGGGGAGGMIVFDAPSVTGTGASIFANGGGGGEGSQYNATGGPGADPASPGQPAGGGSGMAEPYGGDGGDGAFGSTPAAPGIGDVSTSYGGGGGGGGVGVIKRYQGNSLPGTVSPPL